MSSSQKNSSSIWNKASRKTLRAADVKLQFQVPEEFQSAVSSEI